MHICSFVRQKVTLPRDEPGGFSVSSRSQAGNCPPFARKMTLPQDEPGGFSPKTYRKTAL